MNVRNTITRHVALTLVTIFISMSVHMLFLESYMHVRPPDYYRLVEPDDALIWQVIYPLSQWHDEYDHGKYRLYNIATFTAWILCIHTIVLLLKKAVCRLVSKKQRK